MGVKMKEIWRPIPGKEGLYEISNLGRVRRCAYLLNPQNNGVGYLKVSIGEKSVTKYVHRLVADVFLGPPPFPLAVVNHKDFNRSNNRADNLEWTSVQGNSRHASKAGRLKGHGQNIPHGSQNHNAKLTDEKVSEIKRLYKPIRGCQADLGRQFGVDSAVIGRIITGKIWKHLL